MGEVEAIYENGVLRVLDPSKIDSEVITVKILNLEEILTEEEEGYLREAVEEREKGTFHTLDELFG